MKISKNLSLDMEVLQKADEIAKEQHSNVSEVVNSILKEKLK